MQFNVRLRKLSIGLAMASFLCAGTAFAQTTDASQSSNPSDQAFQLVGVNARLDQALDTKSAKQGETVTAKLDGTVKTASGVKLERGTVLTGTVTSVQPAANGGASSLAVAFTTAQTKDGKQIPVKVTVIGAFPSSEGDLALDGADSIPPAPQHVNSQEGVDQESGLLHNIALHSSAQAQNSGTFTRKEGNLKLNAGTYLQIGIAPLNGNTTASRGE